MQPLQVQPNSNFLENPTTENASKLINLLTNAALNTKSGDLITPKDALQNSKVVGLYFSMHGCPPCRGFTPKLAEHYTEINTGANSNEKPFEVIFVSGDQDLETYEEYYGEMPWLALPFKDPRIRSLSQHYQVRSVPRLVIVNLNGDIIHENAVKKVSDNGVKALQEFIAGKDGNKGQLTQVSESNSKQDLATDEIESYKTKVQEVIQTTPVVIFSKTWCPFCAEAKDILSKGNVKFFVRELDIESDGAVTQGALEKLTGQTSVPNIFIGGKHVGGCSDLKDKLKSGEVKILLDAASVTHEF
eukprot:403366395